MKLLPLLLLVPMFDVSSDTYLTASLGSYHFGQPSVRSEGFNEVNPGVGIRHGNVSVGVYDNSYYQTSVYAAYDFDRKISRYVSVGISTGVVTGYSQYEENYTFSNDLMPFLAPSITLGGDFGVKISYIPATTSVVAVQLQWRI